MIFAGATNADDFRDYMLSFLFLRYLSVNYETAAKKELGKDYPRVSMLAVDAWAKYDNVGESPILLEWGESQ